MSGIVVGRRVVVTGKVPNESRITAEAKLREAGAIVQSAVGKDTDVLVTGANVGLTKINKAKALGVEIVPWEQAFNGKSSGSKAPLPPPRAPMPAVRQWAPMLCKTGELPAGVNWSYEVKWDGVRCVATIKDGAVALQSRSGLTDYTERYPDVAEELSHLRDCVLDGELVEMGAELWLLGEDCDPATVARYIVFDVLVEGDQETTARPLSDRRQIMELLVPGGCYVARSPVFEDGQVLLDYVIEKGLEGVVAKQNDSRYVEGGRGPTWLKVKVRREQEFIVLGYTPGEGHREWAFGALILGYYEGEEIRYAGKVGTGFDDACLAMLMAKMAPMVVGESPYDADLPKDLRGSTWLSPGIVVQTAFQKWTEDGRLWHPSFLKVRDDKNAKDVTRDA